MKTRPLGDRNGVALVLTLLVVSLLTVVVLDSLRESRVRSALAGVYRDETKALFAARSGQETAKLILLEDAKSNISRDALTEEWAQTAIPVPIDDNYAFVSIRDESGKVNVNHLTTSRGYPDARWDGIFRRLLKLLDLDPELAGAVADWIDANHEVSDGGAEEGYYMSLVKPYHVKNAKLDSVDELLMVKGFSPKVMAKLRPHITVWSSEKININTATPLTLMALDDMMTEEMVKGIIRMRGQNPFAKREHIKRIPGVDAVYANIALAIDTRSDYFSVDSTSTIGDVTKTVQAVYRRESSALRTIYYKVF